jgi:hypothetical protein
MKINLNKTLYFCNFCIFQGYIANHHLHNGHSPVGISSFMKDQDMTPKLAKSHSNRNSAPVFSADKKASSFCIYITLIYYM